MNNNTSEQTVAMPAAPLLFSMTPDQVTAAIQASGCAVTAVEQDGVVRLHSASQGIGFQVLWGSALAEGEYVDLTLSCPLRVQGGALPEAVLSDWHRSKRFARVARHGDFVVLEMDVIAAGGISPDHLSMLLQLWNQMMGKFFLHLRNFKPADAPEAAAAAVATAAVATAAVETAPSDEAVAA